MDKSGIARIATEKDCVQFYARHLSNMADYGEEIFFGRGHNHRDDLIHSWLEEYHYEGVTKSRRTELRQKIFNNTLFIIPYALKKWNLRTEIFEDAFQLACTAVLAAIDKFDPTRGVKFSYFLTSHRIIDTAAREAQRLHNVVNVGTHKKQTVQSLQDKRLDLEYGDYWEEDAVDASDNNDEEEDPIAKESQHRASEWQLTGAGIPLDYAEGCASIALQGEEDESRSMESVLFCGDIRAIFEDLLSPENKYFSDAEKIVLKHRYGLLGAATLTNKEIRSLLKSMGRDVTEARTSQYHTKALEKARSYLESLGITEEA